MRSERTKRPRPPSRGYGVFLYVKTRTEYPEYDLMHIQEHEHANRHLTVWPSGLRRWLKAPVRKGVGANPTAANLHAEARERRR